MTLATYPEGCLNRSDLDPLVSVRFIYIDNSTAFYVDHGTNTAPISDNIKGNQLLPNDPYVLQCDMSTTRNVAFGNQQNSLGMELQEEEVVPLVIDDTTGGGTNWTDDFLRLNIQNPFDLSPRTFMAHIPKCYR